MAGREVNIEFLRRRSTFKHPATLSRFNSFYVLTNMDSGRAALPKDYHEIQIGGISHIYRPFYPFLLDKDDCGDWLEWGKISTPTTSGTTDEYMLLIVRNDKEPMKEKTSIGMHLDYDAFNTQNIADHHAHEDRIEQAVAAEMAKLPPPPVQVAPVAAIPPEVLLAASKQEFATHSQALIRAVEDKIHTEIANEFSQQNNNNNAAPNQFVPRYNNNGGFNGFNGNNGFNNGFNGNGGFNSGNHRNRGRFNNNNNNNNDNNDRDRESRKRSRSRSRSRSTSRRRRDSPKPAPAVQDNKPTEQPSIPPLAYAPAQPQLQQQQQLTTMPNMVAYQPQQLLQPAPQQYIYPAGTQPAQPYLQPAAAAAPLQQQQQQPMWQFASQPQRPQFGNS